jgi:hypothetical protein
VLVVCHVNSASEGYAQDEIVLFQTEYRRFYRNINEAIHMLSDYYKENIEYSCSRSENDDFVNHY